MSAPALSSLKFNCPACQQRLSAPPDLVGKQIACPNCGNTVSVIALEPVAPATPRRGSLAPKVAAAVAFVAILAAVAFFLKGEPAAPAPPGANSLPKPAQAQASVAVPPVVAPTPNLADQMHGTPIKRSGSSNWEVAFAYYAKTAGAAQIMFSNQERKGKLAILAGRLVVDQVGDTFITATHSASSEQWVLHPDSPLALDEISLSEGTSIAQLVGVYAGPEQMETVGGAPRRLPSMIVFGMLTSTGYVDFEDPHAGRASATELKPHLDAHEAKEAAARAEEKAELDAREAERLKQRAKDIADLEQDPSWNPKAKAGQADSSKSSTQPMKESAGNGHKRVVQPNTDNVELAKARADLAAVKSKIDSERKRHGDALNVINTLTKNKTVPVKDGSPAYHRCLEASRVIGEVERGAADLKAEKARLETLVGELDPEIQE